MKYLPLVLVVVAMGTQAQSAIPISGDFCPPLYDKKGDMCVPREGATVAVVKDGECPDKMIEADMYCVAPKSGQVTVIIPPKKD